MRGMTERLPSTERLAAVGTTSLSFRVLRRLSELASIADDWDDLVFRVTGRPPVTSHAWVASLLEHQLDDSDGLLCLAAYEDERLVGVMPVGLRPTKVLGKAAVEVHQPGKPRNNSVDAVMRPGYERRVLAGFREALDEEVPGWYGLEFLWVDHASPLLHVEDGLGPRSVKVSHAAGRASAVDTRVTWEEFSSRLGQGLRKQIKRAYSRITETVEVRTEFLAGAEARPECLDRFMAVEASGWKGQARTAIAANARVIQVHRSLCTRLHRRGMLEFHFLKLGDRDIAAHMAVRSGRTLYLYKIGYDEAFSRYSPGVLLRELTLARAIADRDTDAVDFMTERAYHEEWRPNKRPLYHVWVYPARPRSIVAGAWPKQIRQELRKVPGMGRLARLIRGETKEGSKVQSRREALAQEE